tara:strand:- start:169 stop:459 length:291 start_codon:yes stop_codon:yes gene_type:complete
MSKAAISIVVRLVESPKPATPKPGQPYQPPKRPVFKSIATCSVNGKRLSKTASMETEAESRLEAFNKLATLVAKHGAVPIKGVGVEIGKDWSANEN